MDKDYYITYTQPNKFPITKGFKLLYTIWICNTPEYTIYKKVESDIEYRQYKRVESYVDRLKIIDTDELNKTVEEVSILPETMKQYVSKVKIQKHGKTKKTISK